MEIWPDSRHRANEQFRTSFRKYIYGDTARGQYGLPFQLRVPNDHGLQGVFMVECLRSVTASLPSRR